MGRLKTIPVTLCALFLCVGFSSLAIASRRPRTTENKSLTRRTRSAQTPIPINCRLGPWSSWTPCNECTDKKLRFRYLEKPSQFGGSKCYESLWDILACPTATQQCMVPDYCGESFTCRHSGRCISQTLRCNGESDCEDSSDEQECQSVNQREDKCSTLMPIPGATRGVEGFNVLSGEFVDHVLDPAYFGEQCEYVYNGEWRKFTYEAFCESLQYRDDEKNYRKPYNYHTYQFMAEATSQGSHEYYDDVVDLLNARKESSSSNGGVTLGVYYVEVGLKASRENEFLRNITQYSSQNLGFVRLWSKVQTARFKIRTDKLMLHEDFYVALMNLPEEYDFGMYSSFIDTFGTHYITEGTMGGTLEYVLVLNKTSMASSNINGEQAGRCFGASIGLNYPVSNEVTAGFHVGGNDCIKDGSFTREDTGNSVTIEDIHTLVKGGIVESSTGLAAIRNPETYRRWGASLKYNPTLIEYEIMPIYELVRFSTAADHVGSRQANLQRAWDEYIQHFHPCRCAPCRHNGITILSGTSCKCVCKEGYRGEACQETRRSDTRTDGSWSCWGEWSSCLSGRKTRSRSCNNPAPDGGGKTCLGSSSQTIYC